MDTTRCSEKAGRRAQKCCSGVASAEPTICYTGSERVATLKRGLVQPQAVTSNRNEVSRTRLARRGHQLFFGRPPRSRSAFVCPLDTGGLIGVRRHFART